MCAVHGARPLWFGTSKVCGSSSSSKNNDKKRWNENNMRFSLSEWSSDRSDGRDVLRWQRQCNRRQVFELVFCFRSSPTKRQTIFIKMHPTDPHRTLPSLRLHAEDTQHSSCPCGEGPWTSKNEKSKNFCLPHHYHAIRFQLFFVESQNRKIKNKNFLRLNCEFLKQRRNGKRSARRMLEARIDFFIFFSDFFGIFTECARSQLHVRIKLPLSRSCSAFPLWN